MRAHHHLGAGPLPRVDLSENPQHQTEMIELTARYFGIAPEQVVAPAVSWYDDESGAIGSYSCPVEDGIVPADGLAVRIDVAMQLGTDLRRRLSMDTVREEHDHPSVRVIEVESPGWTIGYSEISGAERGAVRTVLTRFVQAEANAIMSVSFEAGSSPLDHRKALELADGIRETLEWERRTGRRS